MNATFRATALALVTASAALLGGCGGGSGSEPDPLAVPSGPSATVPDAAIQSVDAYTRFAARVIREVGDSATAAPLLLPTAQAPVSDSEAPSPVD